MKPGQVYLCEVCKTECIYRHSKHRHSICYAFKVDEKREIELLQEEYHV